MRLTVPKLQLRCVLPYTGKSSLDLRVRVRRMTEKNIPFCKLNVVFRSTCRLGNCLRFKDSLEKNSSLEKSTAMRVVTARLLITEKPSDCFFYQRVCVHENLHLTEKRIKNIKVSAISDHLLQCDSPKTFDDFDILTSDSNKFELLIKEHLLIKRDVPI